MKALKHLTVSNVSLYEETEVKTMDGETLIAARMSEVTATDPDTELTIRSVPLDEAPRIGNEVLVAVKWGEK